MTSSLLPPSSNQSGRTELQNFVLFSPHQQSTLSSSSLFPLSSIFFFTTWLTLPFLASGLFFFFFPFASFSISLSYSYLYRQVIPFLFFFIFLFFSETEKGEREEERERGKRERKRGREEKIEGLEMNLEEMDEWLLLEGRRQVGKIHSLLLSDSWFWFSLTHFLSSSPSLSESEKSFRIWVRRESRRERENQSMIMLNRSKWCINFSFLLSFGTSYFDTLIQPSLSLSLTFPFFLFPHSLCFKNFLLLR